MKHLFAKVPFFFQTSKLKHHKKTSDPFQFFPVVLSCFLWAYRHPSHFFKPDATRQRSITEKHVRPLRSPMLMIRVTWSPNKAPTVVAVGSQNLGKMMHSGRISNMQLWIDSMVWIYIIYNTSSPTTMFFFSLDVTICFFTDEVKHVFFFGAIIFTCLSSDKRCFGCRGVLQLCGIFGHWGLDQWRGLGLRVVTLPETIPGSLPRIQAESRKETSHLKYSPVYSRCEL